MFYREPVKILHGSYIKGKRSKNATLCNPDCGKRILRTLSADYGLRIQSENFCGFGITDFYILPKTLGLRIFGLQNPVINP